MQMDAAVGFDPDFKGTKLTLYLAGLRREEGWSDRGRQGTLRRLRSSEASHHAEEHLQELAQAPLPLTLTDQDAIRKVELLRAALLIDATFQPATLTSLPRSATVHAITRSGWSLLAKQLPGTD